MRIFRSLVLVSASFVAASAYGYKYSRNPYTGECKLQLSLPGGSGQKDAYTGPMNTRYGSNEAKYGSQSGSKYHGAASSQQSSLTSGSHGGSASGSYVSGNNGASNGWTKDGNSGWRSGEKYGGSQGGTSSEYDSSSSNKQNNRHSSSNYGETSGNYQGGKYNDREPVRDNYGGGNSKYDNGHNHGSASSNYGAASSSGDRHYQSSASSTSANRENSHSSIRDRDRNTAGSNYESSIHDRDRNTAGSNYASSSTRDRDRNPGSSYGGSSSSGGNYGSSSYDRDRDEEYSKQASRESNYESSASKQYGSSSSTSGNRGSSSSSMSGYRPTNNRESNRDHHAGSSGNKGSSYGGSSESYGESDRNSYGHSGSSAAYTKAHDTMHKGSDSSPSSSPAYSPSFAPSDRDNAYDRPHPSTSNLNKGAEDYREEYSSSKSVNKSNSSKTTKEVTYIGDTHASIRDSGVDSRPSSVKEYDGEGSQNYEKQQTPSQFDDCGVHEYYSKLFKKCIRFGSREDDEIQREKNGKYTASSSKISSSGSAASIEDLYDSNRKSSTANYNSGSSGSSSDRYSNAGGTSSSSYSSDEDRRNWSKTQGADVEEPEDEYLMKEFASQVLKTHNSYRARHTTPPVHLDERMSIKAQEWAYDLAAGRVAYGHSPDAIEGNYGESLQILNDPATTGKEAVAKWYGERHNYDFRKPTLVKSPLSKSNSHFTAIVWKGTRKIGVGKATSKDGRTFVVVNYWPPPNIVDVLEDNVLPSRTDLGSDRETFY